MYACILPSFGPGCDGDAELVFVDLTLSAGLYTLFLAFYQQHNYSMQ